MGVNASIFVQLGSKKHRQFVHMELTKKKNINKIELELLPRNTCTDVK